MKPNDETWRFLCQSGLDVVTFGSPFRCTLEATMRLLRSLCNPDYSRTSMCDAFSLLTLFYPSHPHPFVPKTLARLLHLARVLYGPHPSEHHGEPGAGERLRRGHVPGGTKSLISFKRAPTLIKKGFGQDDSVVLHSWVWTWRNWKTWRKMLVWEMEVWDVLPVSIF